MRVEDELDAGLSVDVAFDGDVKIGLVKGWDPLRPSPEGLGVRVADGPNVGVVEFPAPPPAPPPTTGVEAPPDAPPLLAMVGVVEFPAPPAPPPITGVEAPPDALLLLAMLVSPDVIEVNPVPFRPSPGKEGEEVVVGPAVETGVDPPAPPPTTGVLAPPEAPPDELLGPAPPPYAPPPPSPPSSELVTVVLETTTYVEVASITVCVLFDQYVVHDVP